MQVAPAPIDGEANAHCDPTAYSVAWRVTIAASPFGCSTLSLASQSAATLQLCLVLFCPCQRVSCRRATATACPPRILCRRPPLRQSSHEQKPPVVQYLSASRWVRLRSCLGPLPRMWNSTQRAHSFSHSPLSCVAHFVAEFLHPSLHQRASNAAERRRPHTVCSQLSGYGASICRCPRYFCSCSALALL